MLFSMCALSLKETTCLSQFFGLRVGNSIGLEEIVESDILSVHRGHQAQPQAKERFSSIQIERFTLNCFCWRVDVSED